MSNKVSKLPKIPTISKQADWLEFWHITSHYLTKTRYSYGLVGSLAHVANGTEMNNSNNSATLDDVLIATIKSDTLTIYRSTCDEYTGKGLKKLQQLQDDYAGRSHIKVAMVMFDFCGNYSQGKKTLLTSTNPTPAAC